LVYLRCWASKVGKDEDKLKVLNNGLAKDFARAAAQGSILFAEKGGAERGSDGEGVEFPFVRQKSSKRELMYFTDIISEASFTAPVVTRTQDIISRSSLKCT
jgi:hypothetical protein